MYAKFLNFQVFPFSLQPNRFIGSEIEPDFNANSESIIVFRSNSGHVIAFPNTNIFNYNRKFGSRSRELLGRRHFAPNTKNHRLVAYFGVGATDDV